MQRISGKSPELARLKGRAVLNIAIGRFKQGAYEEAHRRFRTLLHPKTGLPGYDRREVSLWHRHAAACFGYHQRRERAGITEPEEIDPECGAASLAVVLRALGRPYDRKSVLAACRVTGFGSSLQDLGEAARKLGLAFHAVVPDEAGLKALPKPVIVHVEHDHFVVLLKADDRGVTYGCSDCGSWPGGRREVTWAQWRLMEPGVVAAVYPRGSTADRALSEVVKSGKWKVESANRKAGRSVRLASTSSFSLPASSLLGQASPLAALTAALKGHVSAYIAIQGGVLCGSHPDSLHCEPFVDCCMDCLADSAVGNGGFTAIAGRSAGDPVNLATGEEEYTPPADLEVYNPSGPSVSWGRIYNSLRGFTADYALDDFGAGWSHPYNINLHDAAVTLNPQAAAGVATQLSSTGTQAPGAGLTWDLVYGGSTIATSAAPNGWVVSLMMGSGAQVTPPTGAASGLNYLLRWKFVQFMQTYNFSAYFDVRLAAEVPVATACKMAPSGSQLPSGTLSWEVRKNGNAIATSDLPAGWKVGFTPFPYELTVTAPLTEPAGSGYEARFRYMMGGLSATFTVLSHRFQAAGGTKYVIWPNGSRSAFSTATPPTAGNPTVLLPATSSGVPYYLRWDYSATEPLGIVSLIGKDRSAWVFGQLAKHGAGPSVYRRPSAILDRLGNGIQLVYGPPAGRYVPDATSAQNYSGYPLLAAIKDGAAVDLLTFSRATDGTGSLLAVNDRYSRSVYYHVGVYNTVNVPAPHPTFYLEVDQVSQIVPTGTGSPPLRYAYGYTNVSIGHSSPLGPEQCPFLTSITVPSPTGTGSATAGIEYEPDTCTVKALTDGNGNRREYSEFAADTTQITLKNSAGAVLQSWKARFNSNMTHAERTDGAGTVTEQHGYSDPNAPHLPSSTKDGMLRETLRTFDAFGNTLTETTPRGTLTVFTWDYNVFPLGRLMSIQEGSKTPTSFTYYEPSGLIATITTPKPGVSGQTVTRTLAYDGLGNPTSLTGPGNNAAATVTTVLNYTTDGPYSQPAKIGQPLTVTNNLVRPRGRLLAWAMSLVAAGSQDQMVCLLTAPHLTTHTVKGGESRRETSIRNVAQETRKRRTIGCHLGEARIPVPILIMFRLQRRLRSRLPFRLLGPQIGEPHRLNTMSKGRTTLPLESAEAAIRRGNLDRAVSLLNAILTLDPANADAHFWMGVAYQQLELLENARASFTESIRLSNDAQAHCSLADVLDRMGDESGAIHHYRIAVDIDPAHAQAYTNLGVMLARRGELETARACYATAIELEPDSAVAYYGLGIVLRRMGDLTRALCVFHIAVLLEAGDADYHVALGGVLDELRLPNEALVHYRKAARIEPERAECSYAMGLILSALGRRQAAVRAFQAAVEKEPANVVYMENLGVALRRVGRLDEAVIVHRQVVMGPTPSIQALVNCAICLRAAGFHEEALQNLERAREQDDTNGVVNYEMGVIREELGELSGAVDHWLLAASAEDAEASYLARRALSAVGQLETFVVRNRSAITGG